MNTNSRTRIVLYTAMFALPCFGVLLQGLRHYTRLEEQARFDRRSKALGHAVRTGDAATIDRLLNMHVPPERAVGALYDAAIQGNVRIAANLLDHGWPMDGKFGGGQPLINAAIAGHADMVNLLLDRGADVNATKGEPLIWAAQRGNMTIAKILLDRGARTNGDGFDGITPLIAAARAGDVGMLGLLLDRGADIDAPIQRFRAAEGTTALMSAAMAGHAAAVRFLLSRHADTRRRNKEGETALALALRLHHDAIARMLRQGDKNRTNVP